MCLDALPVFIHAAVSSGSCSRGLHNAKTRRPGNSDCCDAKVVIAESCTKHAGLSGILACRCAQQMGHRANTCLSSQAVFCADIGSYCSVPIGSTLCHLHLHAFDHLRLTAFITVVFSKFAGHRDRKHHVVRLPQGFPHRQIAACSTLAMSVEDVCAEATSILLCCYRIGCCMGNVHSALSGWVVQPSHLH